jgi:hypothetical protein
MLKPILLGALLLSPTAAFAQTCLHGPNETPGERIRREQAIQFARQVNAAEKIPGPWIDPQRPQRRYRPLNELPNLPRVPAGFVVKLQTDGASYTFSLKDSRDACGFAVFSDQEGDVYASMPEPHQVTILPLGTR